MSKYNKLINSLISKYGKSEVKTGLKVEKEHDDITKGNKEKIAKIASAHLSEVPDYYHKLKKYVEN